MSNIECRGDLLKFSSSIEDLHKKKSDFIEKGAEKALTFAAKRAIKRAGSDPVSDAFVKLSLEQFKTQIKTFAPVYAQGPTEKLSNMIKRTSIYITEQTSEGIILDMFCRTLNSISTTAR